MAWKRWLCPTDSLLMFHNTMRVLSRLQLLSAVDYFHIVNMYFAECEAFLRLHAVLNRDLHANLAIAHTSTLKESFATLYESLNEIFIYISICDIIILNPKLILQKHTFGMLSFYVSTDG